MTLSQKFNDKIFGIVKKFVEREIVFLDGIIAGKANVLKLLQNNQEADVAWVKAILQEWKDSSFQSDELQAFIDGEDLAIDDVLYDSALSFEAAKVSLEKTVLVNTNYLEGVKLAAKDALEVLAENKDYDRDDFFHQIGEMLNEVEDNYPSSGDIAECRYSDGQSDLFERILEEV